MDFVSGSAHIIPGLGFPALPLRGTVHGEAFAVNLLDNGLLQITGTTKNVGTPEAPVGRRVRLHDQPSGRVVAEVWSDPVTGAYTFTNLRPGVYYILGFDHTGQYDGDSETDVVSEPMP